MEEFKWDRKTQLEKEYSFDFHWILIRQVRRKRSTKWQCLFGTHRKLIIPEWYEEYYDFFKLDKEFHRWGKYWNKLHEKTFNAHCLICSNNH